MNTIYVDAPYSDEERRQRLYNGQLFVFSPCPSAQALAAFAREMAEEAFAPLDPREAQYTLPVGGLLLFSGAQLHSTVPNTSGRTLIDDQRRVAKAAWRQRCWPP